MDPALLRERELFKKRALITPSVEKKKREPEKDTNHENSLRKKPKTSVSGAPKLDAINYKTLSGSSQYKFGVLAKIVRHMRTKYQEGDDQPLTLEEILDETNQLDVGSKIRQWLQTESLHENPKIEVSLDGRFCFKPMYKLKDKKSLLRLLKQHDLKGLGGIFLEDVQESLPHCDKHLKSLQNEIIYVTRPNDKKKILYYNDKTAHIAIDEEFKKLWRAIPVDAMDDQKIEEYLEKQGIRSMQDHGIKKPIAVKRKKPVARRKINRKPKDNNHMADILVDYDEAK